MVSKGLKSMSNSFIPDDCYGYKVDISNPKIKPLYERYKKWKGIPSWCPLSDDERLEFESYILKGDDIKNENCKRTADNGYYQR